MKTNTTNSKYSGRRQPRVSVVDKFGKYLQRRMRQGISNRSKLYREVQEQGYTGHYASVNRYVNRVANELKVKRYKPSIRFETGPGEQAQVDWGYFKTIEANGKTEKLYCFVLVLSYSRMMYIEFTIRQTQKTLQQCHINAFKRLGIPQTIVYDNMKTVVAKRRKLPDGKEDIEFNKSLLYFAKHYGFAIKPCPPYWPRAKGKVEAAVKYIRNNFMLGMSYKKGFSSLDDLNQKATLWLSEANTRVHATTKRRPIDLWKKEKQFLQFPDSRVFQISSPVTRFSTKDGAVSYDSSFYCVPDEHRRKELLVREINTNGRRSIEIYDADELVAKYFLASEKNKWVTHDECLLEKCVRKRKRLQKAITVKQKRKNERNKPLVFSRPLTYYDQYMARSRHE